MNIINKILEYRAKNVQVYVIAGMIAFGAGISSALDLFNVGDDYLRFTPPFLILVYYVFSLIGKDNPSLKEWTTNTFVGVTLLIFCFSFLASLLGIALGIALD